MVTFEMGNPDPVTMFCYTDVLFIQKCGRTTGPRMLHSGPGVACEVPHLPLPFQMFALSPAVVCSPFLVVSWWRSVRWSGLKSASIPNVGFFLREIIFGCQFPGLVPSMASQNTVLTQLLRQLTVGWGNNTSGDMKAFSC